MVLQQVINAPNQAATTPSDHSALDRLRAMMDGFMVRGSQGPM